MPTPDSLRTPTQPSARRLYGLYLAALAAALLGNLLIRFSAEAGRLPGAGRAVLGIAAAAPLFAAAGLFWRLLARDLDELVQRIVLEGLAFALIVSVPLTALYLNLRAAGVGLPRLDPPDLLMAPAILVALGIALAQRRYQ
ncbi:MAG: hypothetical protein IPL96_03805 [Holophagaceae bacterium]|nr:hypothetical protein [Holophagaceae bacterium]